MANYTYTNEPGTSRRRAKKIIIDNPSNGTPIVTFETEDRIIMADGTEIFVPQEDIIKILDQNALIQKYKRFDIESGKSLGKDRTGLEIISTVFPAITDLFIDTALALEEANKKSISSDVPVSNDTPVVENKDYQPGEETVIPVVNKDTTEEVETE